MDHTKLLTVFVVTYNRANYLYFCIESILNQTYDDFKLIILDNASTDYTHDVVDSFKDNRIQYIKHKENIGGINNINYAINICDTKYFVIFHDDDLMNSDMLEKEIAEMENNNEYSLVSSSSSFIDGEGNAVDLNESLIKDKISLFRGDSYLSSYLSRKQGIICPTVMYRNPFIKEKGLVFRQEVGPAADQYFWFEVEKYGGTICRINEALIKYRLHGLQDSQLNSMSMVVDLLVAINNNIIDNKKSSCYLLLQKYIVRLSSTISRKYVENKVSLSLYNQLMDKLESICSKKSSNLMLKYVKFITINLPALIRIEYNLLQVLRKIKNN